MKRLNGVERSNRLKEIYLKVEEIDKEERVKIKNYSRVAPEITDAIKRLIVALSIQTGDEFYI